MKKFKFIKDGEELTTPNDCESATERTGRDEEFVFQSLSCYDGPIDFSPLECMAPADGVDHFEWLPDQFDAIFCGIEYEMMIFQCIKVILVNKGNINAKPTSMGVIPGWYLLSRVPFLSKLWQL